MSAALAPHLLAVALIAARLVPVAFLCPLLGGPQAPATVKLAVVLALALFLHLEAGVGPAVPVEGVPHAAALALAEACLGTALGLLAALPFDAARTGGRLVDLFRGSSAEAALPLTGSREAAAGELLHHLLLALAASGALASAVLGALLRSFAWAPPGVLRPSEGAALAVARLVGGALATALALATPVAAAALAVDSLLGLAGRAAPSLRLQELAGPLRLLGGAGTAALALPVLAPRLLGLLEDVPAWLGALAEAAGR